MPAGVLRLDDHDDHDGRWGEHPSVARLELLLEAKGVLTSSLDTHVVVERLATFLVPRLASFCEVAFPDDDGVPRTVTIAHADPEKVALAHEVLRRYPPRKDRVQGTVEVMSTGRSRLYSEIRDEGLVAIAEDEEHLRLLRELGVRSAMIVPMTVRDRTIGVLALTSTDRRFGELDLSLAESIGHHAALALDHARLYEAERRARIEAEQANRAKDEFLGVVSHELRTPLNAIFGWANILRLKTRENTVVQKGLEVIERNARAQARIVEDILDVSRIITGKLTLELRPVQLDPILAAAVEVVRPAAEAKGIFLDVRVEAGLPAVAGDPDRLQQVFWNLLSNAVKFTPEGGRVEVVLGRDGGEARVTVTDTGAGIDPSFLPFVFERFRQADSSTQRRYGGLGLGLAIVRHLVDLHGGRVTVASDGQGRGACFTVRLPIPVERGAVTPRFGTRRLDPEIPPEAALLAGLKALAVDDDPDALELLNSTLSAFGVLVYAAPSAKAAIRAFDEFDPEVVISDIGMPGEDGYSLIRRIRDLPRQKGQVPAIALTAYARETDAENARAAGFQAHLAKPIDTTLLCAVLASVTGRLRSGE